MSQFTLPSASYLTTATRPAYESSYYAPFGATGAGGGLPPGAQGDYLFYDGIDWVAQNDPILMGPGVSGGSSGSGNIAIGTNANTASAGSNNVAIGTNATIDTSARGSVAIGYNSIVSPNANNQGVAIGFNADVENQGGVAIGPNAKSGDGITCTSVGINAGNSNNSKDGNVSIGWYSGNANPAGLSANQGNFAINIGAFAGYAGSGSADNSITINAQGQSGPTINSLSAEFSSLYVAPILASTMANYLSYDPVSKLVGYGAPAIAPITLSTYSTNGSYNVGNVGPNCTFGASFPVAFVTGTKYQITSLFQFDITQDPSASLQQVALNADSFFQVFIVNGGIDSGTIVACSPPTPCGTLPTGLPTLLKVSLTAVVEQQAPPNTLLWAIRFYHANDVSNPTNPANAILSTYYALT